MAGDSDERELPRLERTTLCLADPMLDSTIHQGDNGFQTSLHQHCSSAEDEAVERLVHLKNKLANASNSEFWTILVEGMAKVACAQYAYVSKSLKHGTQAETIIDPISEPGHTMLAVAFYQDDGNQPRNIVRDRIYWTSGAPYSVMDHNKVFLVPKKLHELFPRSPNFFPSLADAYMGLPLFMEGEHLGHFSIMWHENGLRDLQLSWPYVESLMHSLEDMIVDQLLQAKGTNSRKIPESSISSNEITKPSQSLRPFARNLSHELRTPMQGVVGMLDVIHATVQETLEERGDPSVRRMLQMLRDNLEAVQDCSRRAVDAADNIVHAYDLDMQIPDTPVEQNEDHIVTEDCSTDAAKAGMSKMSPRGTKRQKISDSSGFAIPVSQIAPGGNSHGLSGAINLNSAPSEDNSPRDTEVVLDVLSANTAPAHALHQTRLRDSLRLIIDESLRVGGRPESVLVQESEGGETIEVNTKAVEGGLNTKMITWSVDQDVPELFSIDEKDFAKLVSCVFLNAVKFTEQGQITLKASLSPKARFVVITVTDTGPGIPDDFLPYLFKPFSREDDSLTREKEGLGLGLLVAKGLARKIGGDLVCMRSDVAGLHRGSTFELRIPLVSGVITSSSPTPSGTPMQGRSGPVTTPQRSFLADQPVKTSSLPNQLSFQQLVAGSFDKPKGASGPSVSSSRRSSLRESPSFDPRLAAKYPLTFLVAEDNSLNRRLLVSMLNKLGYNEVHEAHDGEEAVNQMLLDRSSRGEKTIDVILMDLWMPKMDGYEAAERIFAIETNRLEALERCENDICRPRQAVIILAVTADVTDRALAKATSIGMSGYMTKPYRLLDLERTILEYCTAGVKDV